MRRFLKIKLFPAVLTFLFCGCCCFKDNTPPELAVLGFKARKEPGSFYHTPTGGTLMLTPEKRLCFINGLQFFLPHAVTVDQQGLLHLSPLSIQKVIKPLFSEQKTLPRIKTVLLDPGHGDHNFGAVGLKYKEKDLNLALAKEIGKALKKRGFDVRYTRLNDKFLSLSQRGNMAKKINGDLFLSIHHNASPNKASCGVETYIVTPKGSASSNDTADELHARAVPGNQHDTLNILLAAELQKSLVQKTRRPDRGVRFARFKVLTLSHLPGALIEAGFLSHPREELLCGKISEQQKTAEAIAEAVARFNTSAKR